ncbi:MAG: hypothetical protein LWW94_03940 [Candidatus Desulfofervidaceae bacterium]|nr:hypothetical protein [Candidatus Desulfofervidaceae bacterium]
METQTTQTMAVIPAKHLKVGKNALKKAIKAKVEREIHELRNQAVRTEEEKVKKIFGLENIKMPKGFGCMDGKLVQITYIAKVSDPKTGQSRTKIEFFLICPFFLPVKILKNKEEKETYISLRFLNGDEIIINSDMSDTKKLASTFANTVGVPLDIKRVKKISSYIADFVSMNRIPIQEVVKRTGWSEDGKIYYLPSLHQDVVWLPDRDGRLSGIRVSGEKTRKRFLESRQRCC